MTMATLDFHHERGRHTSAALLSKVILLGLVLSSADPTSAFATMPAGQKQPCTRPSATSRVTMSSTSSSPSSSPSSPLPPPPPMPSPPPPPSKRPTPPKKRNAGGSSSIKFGGRVTTSPTAGSQGGAAKAGEAAKEQGTEGEEEDVRKSARWGVKPPQSPAMLGAGLKNPLEGVGSSLNAVGQGVTAAKDALYGAADVAGSLVELGQKQQQQQQQQTKQTDGATGSQQPPQKATAAASKTSGVVGALRALGGGAVVVKDAFWGSLEVLGAAADAAKKAPEAARTAVEDGKAAIEGGKKNVQAVVRAPVVAAEAVSDALGTAGRAATSLKEGVYGAADSVSRLASAPAEMAERRRRQQQEREVRAAETAADRKDVARKLETAVTGAKAAVWGTVEGVETIVDTVVAAPAAVEDGFVKAQEAVSSAGELLESIPRTVQDIPTEAQKKADGVLASVASTQDAANKLVSGIKGGVDGVSDLAKRASAIASGKAKQEKEEREKREAERRREEKKKNALVTFQGEPYTAKDLLMASIAILGATAKGAVGVGKGLATFATDAQSAPAEVARVVLGPFYAYQQSQRRVQQAVELSTKDKAKELVTASPPPTAAAAINLAPASDGSSTSTSTGGSSSSPTVGSSSTTAVGSSGKSSTAENTASAAKPVTKAATTEFQEERAAERDFLKQAQADAGGESGTGSSSDANANADAKARGVGGTGGGSGSSLSKEGVLNMLTAEGVPGPGAQAEGEGQANSQAGGKGKEGIGGEGGEPRASWSKTSFGKKK